jgi:hypothetical protein
MRSKNNTKESIKKWLHISASPQTRDRIWREILIAQEQSGGNNSAIVRPVIWRKIMKSSTTKMAAAAVIIIVVILGFNFFDRPDMAGVAFAEVKEAVKKVQWMHIVGKNWTRSTNDYYKFEHWISLPNGIIAKNVTVSDNKFRIIWSDYRNHKREIYDSNSGTLTLRYENRELSVDGSEPVDYLKSIIEPTIKKYSVITKRKESRDGRQVNVYELKYNEDGYAANAKFITDVSNNLPITISFEVLGEDGKPSFTQQGQCYYPADGPADIYDLGVPVHAVIIDEFPVREIKDVIDTGKRYRENFIEKNKNYILIFTRGAPSRGGVTTVYICYKCGELQRIEQYDCSPPRRDLKDIENDFDFILRWAKTNKPVLTYLYDGKYWHLSDYWQKNYERSVHRSGFDNYLVNSAWEFWYWSGSIVQDEYSRQNGLICFDPGDRWRFYINPKYDYICHRRQEHVPNLEQTSIWEVKEYARTQDGQWYPKIKHLSYIKETAEGQQGLPELGFIETWYLKLNPEFPEGIFEPDNLQKEFD